MSEAIRRCRLDLAGQTVLTEAATGAYVCTPVMAAMAGADVVAYARGSAHGSPAEIRALVTEVADCVGVGHRIRVVDYLDERSIREATVVTNSGHLRPLDDAFISKMQPTAVVPLMMEAWEIDAGRVDVDLNALQDAGIRCAGTNERHPDIRVFDFLGVMVVKLLVDALVPVSLSRILLICDNPFSPFIAQTLTSCGASVQTVGSADEIAVAQPADAVVVALTPRRDPRIAARHLEDIRRCMPHAVLTQFFGDIDRAAASQLGIACWPQVPPRPGHMGILPSAIGPEPIIRLQSGGLKVGEVLRRSPRDRSPADLDFLDELHFG